MSRLGRDYLMALVVCIAAAAAYRFIVVPFVEPAAIQVVVPKPARDEPKVANLDDLFPEGAWQRDDPKVLEAEWGTLYFRDWQQDQADRWRVSPVTVILRRPANDEKASETDLRSPIILDAEEGAIVEFAEPLNMLTGATPQIKGGQLVGDVSIYNVTPDQSALTESAYQVTSSNKPSKNPSNKPNRQLAANEQPFELQTRNVRIDGRQIRSAEHVDLKLAGAILRGRDLTIHLAGGETLGAGSESTPLSVLDSLELIYLEELRVPLPDGPLWAPIDPLATAASNNAPTTTASPSPAELSLQCDGRVLFDFTSFTLSLLEGVRIEHLWSAEGKDSFACRTLDLQLVNPFLRDRATTTKEATDSSPQAKVAAVLRKIDARGAPLQATVPSLASQLAANRLFLDVENRLIQLTGDQSPVLIEHQGFRWSGSQIEYRLHPTDPMQLGSLNCPGGGEIVVQSEQIPLQRLRWLQGMKLVPEGDLHRLWLQGNVVAQTTDGGTAGANMLLVELKTTSEEPQLEKIWANGNVFVDLPQFSAKTEEFFVDFERSAVDTRTADDQAGFSLGPTLNPPTGPRSRQWITGPEASNSTALVTPVARPRPQLEGKKVNAQLTLYGNQVIAHDVSVENNVNVDYELTTENGRLPLKYTGSSLRMVRDGRNDQIQISGQPARIALGDGFFEGPVVVVDGVTNRVLINERGTFQMPTQVMPAGNSVQVRWLTPPRCDFLGELVFDGQTVDIQGNVQLSGRIANKGTATSNLTADQSDVADSWEVIAGAPQLLVSLSSGVQVTNPTSARETAIQTISLVGGQQAVQVVANNRTLTGELLGRHVLVTPRLDFWATTGQLRGDGPGWYRAWTPSKEDGPLKSISQPGALTSAHLIYGGGIEGDVANQQLSFFHAVRIGVGLVANWDKQLDANAMSQLQINQGTIDCDRLVLGRVRTNGAGTSRVGNSSLAGSISTIPWEVQALGGVGFRILRERGLVSGTVNRMVYDSSRDRFMLDGTPAVINYRDLNNQPLLNASLQYFVLNAKTLEIDAQVQEATLNGVQNFTRQ